MYLYYLLVYNYTYCICIPFPHPRLVYRWFLLIYQGTYALGIIGYLILLLIFTGLGLLLPFKPDTVMEVGVTMVFYGVYYGVLGRDCAELCVDFMAASMTVSICSERLIYIIMLMSVYKFYHSKFHLLALFTSLCTVTPSE